VASEGAWCAGFGFLAVAAIVMMLAGRAALGKVDLDDAK
jgi:hypothetical protein